MVRTPGATRWLLLIGAIVCEVAGSLALKAALTAPAFYAVVAVGYLASFLFLSAVLRRGVPLGVANGIWAALGVASTALLSAVLFDESLTAVMGLGLVLVVAGVLVVELGSQAAQRAADVEARRDEAAARP